MLNLGELLVKIGVDSTEAKKGLQQFGSDVDKTESTVGGKFKALGSKMGKVLKAGAIAGAAAVGAATIKITKDALAAYAQFEQLEGGVKKIFGEDDAKAVAENAQNAFRTAGLSANQYMEQITSFSASLIQSLGGDTKAAAEVGDMAIKDMADNANTFGTSIESIQNAYQGFAKQNYTMLDNLKLGYGGTKTEMERLLSDAEELTGVHYDISNLSDVYNAIHAVQEEMNITGTTAKEAMSTIEGSVNATKAAWQNLLVGLGDEDADLDTLIENLLTSVEAAASNIIPRVGQILSSLWSVVSEKLGEAFSNIDLDAVGDTIAQKIGDLGTFIADGLQGIADKLNNGDGSGIAASLNTLVGKAVIALIKALPSIFVGLWNALDAILWAGITGFGSVILKGVKSLGKWFSDGWKSVKESASKGIDGIKTAIKDKFGKIVEEVKQEWQDFKDGFKEAISPVVNLHPIEKIKSVVKKVKTAWEDFKSAFKSKISAAINSQPLNKLKQLIDKVKKAWENFKNTIKSKLSPAFNFGPFQTLKGWIDKAKGWWDSLRTKLSNAITGKVSTSGGGSVNGNYTPKRVGIHTVPYDDYKASLHKGEAVLTAAEANVWKRFIDKSLFEKPEQTVVEAPAPSTTYNFGNITVDVSKLEDLTTVNDFVDMMIRAKAFA